MTKIQNQSGVALREPEREIPVAAHFDVIVCGGGPAGIAAAIRSAREGCSTLLIEGAGFLGGIWTAGLLSLVLDAGGAHKGRIMKELQERLIRLSGFRSRYHEHKGFTYDAEVMKTAVEQLCLEAGVSLRLYTTVVSAVVEDEMIQGVITESVSGREAFTASMFVDCTGNGTLAYLAGCSYEVGHPATGQLQPASLISVVSGVPSSVDVDTPQGLSVVSQMFKAGGIQSSYQHPGFIGLPNDCCSFGFHHAYGVRFDSAEDWTQASIEARKELQELAAQIKGLPGWSAFQVRATASSLGIREGRRITGLYVVGVEDLKNGSKFKDGICTVYFPVDVHALDGKSGIAYANEDVQAKPYQIPLRSLISSEIKNLGMAGRCVSGDFYAHASYRVTGNSVPMGEAIGLAVALAVKQNESLHDLDGETISHLMLDQDDQAEWEA
ncbi:MAG: glucose-inhibited division protein [Paenibacillaceae bacterium]|jgi:hypothetical protein|nr:glucose-inhibited division protein [Paenibacillaceae bacterium]